MQPNKERIQKLLDAARSGQYVKTEGKLKSELDNCFCFLGLACEVYRKETGEGYWEGAEFYTGIRLEDYDDEDGEVITREEYGEEDMPETVKEWFGVDLQNKCNIINLNDNEHLPLDVIADKVETCLFGAKE